MKDEAPYLRVELSGGVVRVEGTASRRLGQVNLPRQLQTGQEVFAEWTWDGVEVVVRNCRFGFFPLFYYATADEFGVSSSIERLIKCGAPTELDEAAVATFLRVGWLVGNDTVFRSIRLVPPNGEVRWRGGRPVVSGGHFFPRTQYLARSSAIEGFGELFRQAVRRRASPEVPTVVTLSGGRDSRHILLELISMGCAPAACFTTHDFPPYREGNIRAASLLCRRLQLPHRVIGQPASRLAAEISKNSLTSFCAIEHAWAVNLFGEVAKAMPIFYDGLAGDALSQSLFLKKELMEYFERGAIVALAERLVDTWSWRTGEDALARVLPADAMYRYSKELAVHRVAEELSTHTSAAIPLKSFNFWNRTRRATALSPFGIADRLGVQSVTPYLDHDVFDFLASLPAELLIDRRFHTDTIHRMHPGFADVPFSADLGMPLVERAWQQRRFLLEAGRYVGARCAGQLVRRWPTARRLFALAGSAGDNLSKRASQWTAPLHAVYLTQLEGLVRSRSGLPDASSAPSS